MIKIYFCWLDVNFNQRSFSVRESARYVKPTISFSKSSPMDVLVGLKASALTASGKSTTELMCYFTIKCTDVALTC